MMKQIARGGGMPGHARDARHGAAAASAARRRPAGPRRARASRVSGNPAKAAQEAAAEKEKAAAAAANPFGNPDGEEVDYEKAAAALDLPKDFSKFLK